MASRDLAHAGEVVWSTNQMSRLPGKGMSLPPAVGVAILECMTVFSCLLSISFSSLHDTEVASLGPFTLKELGGVSLILRDLFVVLHLEMHLKGGAVSDSRPHPFEWTALADVRVEII